jgi:hypothetical protein
MVKELIVLRLSTTRMTSALSRRTQQQQQRCGHVAHLDRLLFVLQDASRHGPHRQLPLSTATTRTLWLWGGSNIGLHSLKPGMMKSDLVKQVPGRCEGQQTITGRPYQAHEGCKLLTTICTFVVKIRAWGPISRHSKGSYRVQEESSIALVYCRLTKIDVDIASRILILNLTTRVCVISKSASY